MPVIDEFENDIKVMLVRIDSEIANINNELQRVDEVVGLDLDVVIEKYKKLQASQPDREFDSQQFKDSNFQLLKAQKLSSLNKALIKFNNLKNELLAAAKATNTRLNGPPEALA